MTVARVLRCGAVGALLFACVMGAGCGGRVGDVESFARIASDVDTRSKEQLATKKEMLDLLQAYNQTVPPVRRLSLLFDADVLGKEAKTALQTRIGSEQDESLRSLLERLSELDDRLGDLHDQIASDLRRLPPAHRVRAGENHYAICMQFLVRSAGVPRKDAERMVVSAALSPTLLEGSDVWMLYEQGRFSTFVTQGESAVSPALLARSTPAKRDRPQQQTDAVPAAAMTDSLVRTGLLLGSVQPAVQR